MCYLVGYFAARAAVSLNPAPLLNITSEDDVQVSYSYGAWLTKLTVTNHVGLQQGKEIGNYPLSRLISHTLELRASALHIT